MACSRPVPTGGAERDVCRDDLKNPRVLHCGHVFCLNCLENLERRKTITCPHCRRNTNIPRGLFVKNLPKKMHSSGWSTKPKLDLTLVTSWDSGHQISAVKVDEENQVVYVAMFNKGQTIHMYSLSGQLGGKIAGNMGLRTAPIALDTKRHLVVAAAGRHVLLFDDNGTQVGKLTPEKLQHLHDIAYLSGEDRYVGADGYAHCLHFISPDTETVVRTVPVEEARDLPGGLRNVYIAASKSPHSSYLATVDEENGLVKLYDGEGNLIRSYGGTGSGFGKLDRPNGLCIDNQNRILVCDPSNHRLVRICPDAVDATREFEVIMDTSSLGLGHPRHVDITEDGLVVMAMYTGTENGPFNIAVFSGYQ